MGSMNAKKGDLVYLEDSRWWLGGLKSIHGTFGEPHDKDGIVKINTDQCDITIYVSVKNWNSLNTLDALIIR